MFVKNGSMLQWSMPRSEPSRSTAVPNTHVVPSSPADLLNSGNSLVDVSQRFAPQITHMRPEFDGNDYPRVIMVVQSEKC